jgi:hypothetical protein
MITTDLLEHTVYIKMNTTKGNDLFFKKYHTAWAERVALSILKSKILSEFGFLKYNFMSWKRKMFSPGCLQVFLTFFVCSK